jgi:hypothetical protein
LYCPGDWSGYIGAYKDWGVLVYPQQARTLLRNSKRTRSRTPAKDPTTIPAIAPPDRDVLPLFSLSAGSPVAEDNEVAVENVVDAAVIVPASVVAGEVGEESRVYRELVQTHW